MDLTGETLGGRYRVERELGGGGMGTVYLATDTAFHDRPVVIKVPHPELLRDESFRRRFLGEIRELLQLQHPRILHVYDAGEHAGVPYAVVQYVEGGDLRERMPKGTRQSLEEVLQWLPPIAEALDFIHGQRRVHRDVKPANILFDRHGNPYLSDFGIATVMRSVEETRAETQLTATGGYVGSPMYAPPEATYRHLTPQYDQYSLALVVYEALSGGFPFEGETASDVMYAKMHREPAPLAEGAPVLPRTVSDALMRGLVRDPAARFATCREFVAALAAAPEPPAALTPRPSDGSEQPPSAGLREAPDAPRPVATAAQKPRGHRGGVAALAAALLVGVALAGGLWWASRQPSDVPPDPTPTLAPAGVTPSRVPTGPVAPLALPPAAVTPSTVPTGPVAPVAPASELSSLEMEPRDETLYAQRNVNLRAEPSTEAERIARVAAGNRVVVTGKVAGRDWYQVALEGGRRAFVWAPLLGPAPPTPAVAMPSQEPHVAGEAGREEDAVARPGADAYRQVARARCLAECERAQERCVKSARYGYGHDSVRCAELAQQCRREQMDSGFAGGFGDPSRCAAVARECEDRQAVERRGEEEMARGRCEPEFSACQSRCG